MKAKLIAIILFAVLMGWLLPHPGYCQDIQPNRTLFYFYSPACKKCQELKAHFLPQLEKDFKGVVRLELRDITRMEDYALLLRLEEKYSPKLDNNVPLFFFEGRFLAPQVIHSELARLLALPAPAAAEERAEPVGILYRFWALRPITVISAGLIDGINPCAFTVIIFFISFLAMQGYKRRELLAIGLAFILAVFLTYILIGVGLFGFLYHLKGFWIVSQIVNIAVGVFSIILGILALYDFFKFRRTRDTQGLVLQLPQYLKNRIHFIIGSRYRNVAAKDTIRKSVFSLILSALITGFLVSIIEAVCTGQVYLPTIVFVLKTTPLKLQALGYLLFYNFLFILPLLVIFFFALVGVTSEQFSRVLKKHLGPVKILMAILFFVLGFSLLYSYFPKAISSAKTTRSLGLAASAERRPRDSSLWDFGKVKEGKVLKHAFILKNESKNVLEIIGVHTSCGCTVSRVKKSRLSPGESTTLDVEFDSKGYSGPTQQYVYLNTDSLDASIPLSINGERNRTIDKSIIRFIIKANVVRE